MSFVEQHITNLKLNHQPHHHKTMRLLANVVLLLLPGALGFHVQPQPFKHPTFLAVTGQQEEGESDRSRRRLVAQSIAACNALAVTAANAADPNKVVLSTESIPTKYVGTSTSASVPALAKSSEMCTAEEERRIQIFERAAPGVVFIDTFKQQRDEFSNNVLEVPLGSGSGFVWDDRGHIVTNYHVVRNAKSAQVAVLTRVFDGDDTSKAKPVTLPSSMRPGKVLTDYKRSVYKAKVIGIDPSKDIAVLKVDAPVFDLYPVDVGSSSSIRVGQTALAIGNPFGLDHTLTAGVISGIGREVRSPIGQPISNVLQTDAAINPVSTITDQWPDSDVKR